MNVQVAVLKMSVKDDLRAYSRFNGLLLHWVLFQFSLLVKYLYFPKIVKTIFYFPISFLKQVKEGLNMFIHTTITCVLNICYSRLESQTFKSLTSSKPIILFRFVYASFSRSKQICKSISFTKGFPLYARS